jgi:hypothetical protein
MAKRAATTDDQGPAAPAADHAEFLATNTQDAPAQPHGEAGDLGLPALARTRRAAGRRKDDGRDRPGGAFIRGATFDEDAGKHFGGHVADAEGNVLAYFDEDQENTGNPEDGDPTDLGKKPFEERPRTMNGQPVR